MLSPSETVPGLIRRPLAGLAQKLLGCCGFARRRGGFACARGGGRRAAGSARSELEAWGGGGASAESRPGGSRHAQQHRG